MHVCLARKLFIDCGVRVGNGINLVRSVMAMLSNIR